MESIIELIKKYKNDLFNHPESYLKSILQKLNMKVYCCEQMDDLVNVGLINEYTERDHSGEMIIKHSIVFKGDVRYQIDCCPFCCGKEIRKV